MFIKSYVLIVLLGLASSTINAQSFNKKVTEQFTYSLTQIAEAKKRNPKVISPRSMRADTLFMVPSKDWTSGFYAGNLWYTYELTKLSLQLLLRKKRMTKQRMI